MTSFFIGFGSSVAATLFLTGLVKYAWPMFQDRYMYGGVRIAGPWDIIEDRDGKSITVGRIDLKQTGRRITGTSERRKQRDGKDSDRKFAYTGHIHDRQVTLTFEDQKGIGFDSGTYVFIVHNDGVTMEGIATFHGKRENQIVSERRTLKKVAS